MHNRSLIDAAFKSNVLFSYGSHIALVGGGFISVTLITRYAGIEIYGMISMMMALSGILSSLLTFRTNDAVVRFYKQGKVGGEPGLCRLALLIGLVLDIVMGILLFLLVNFAAHKIAASLLKDPRAQTGVSIFSGFMLVTFLRGTPLGFLVAEERFRLINSLSVVEQFMKVLLLGGMVSLGVTLSFENIILAMMIPAILITSVVYISPLRKLAGPLRNVVVPRHHLAEYGRFSLSTFISSSIKAGGQNIDTIILGYFTNSTSVGIYNLFRQFLGPVTMLATPFTGQVLPRFVQAVSEKRVGDIHATIAHANGVLWKGFCLMLLVIVPALLYYVHWNRLNFTAEHYMVFALMVGSVFFLQQLWWTRSFSLAINPALIIQGSILMLIFLPSLMVIFIKLAGFVGAGIGLFLTYFSLYLFYRKCLHFYAVNAT